MDEKFGRALILLLKKLNISSLTDLGCGNGGYVNLLANFAGITAYGFDGNPYTNTLDISGGNCIGPIDITSDYLWNQTDVAMSIEVAEHIPAYLEGKFLKNLVGIARKIIILSWDTPGKRGIGQVNGQTAKSVEDKMRHLGWTKNEKHTQYLKNNATYRWLKRNIQVFEKLEDSLVPNNLKPTFY